MIGHRQAFSPWIVPAGVTSARPTVVAVFASAPTAVYTFENFGIMKL